ncbi:hypothetical protein [Paenibacillus lautus]|uniref:hypothetical protein n=1 Tax=Paenibacillus lautus TaxID=1401 RepID=UPI003D265843
MFRYLIQDQKLKKSLYTICFSELTLRKTLLNRSAKWFEVISVLSSTVMLVIFVISIIKVSMGIEHLGHYYGIGMATLFIVSFYSLLASIWFSRKHIRRTYKDLSFLIEKRKFSYDKEVLFYIRCNHIYQYLKKKKFEHEKLDDLIAFYNEKGESLKKKRWIPFATFATFVFPFWNTSVSKFLDWNDINKVITLFLFTFLLVILVWIWRKAIEQLLFSSSNNYLELAKILQAIKTFPKF